MKQIFDAASNEKAFGFHNTRAQNRSYIDFCAKSHVCQYCWEGCVFSPAFIVFQLVTSVYLCDDEIKMYSGDFI